MGKVENRFNYIYFESLVDQDIVTNVDIAKVVKLTEGYKINEENHDIIREYAKKMKGVGKEVESPSIMSLLQHGHKTTAVKIYYNNHDVTLGEAKKIIDELDSFCANIEL